MSHGCVMGRRREQHDAGIGGGHTREGVPGPAVAEVVHRAGHRRWSADCILCAQELPPLLELV